MAGRGLLGPQDGEGENWKGFGGWSGSLGLKVDKTVGGKKGVEGHSQFWANLDEGLNSDGVGSPELVLKPSGPHVTSTDQPASVVRKKQ